MAFTKTPTTWLAGWSENGTDITLPIASLPQLTAAEADGTTGDIRKILFALCDALANAWNALAEADRPAKMAIARSTSVNDQTGGVRRAYTLQFDLAAVAEEVEDEA
jgi:hypothetical protein